MTPTAVFAIAIFALVLGLGIYVITKRRLYRERLIKDMGLAYHRDILRNAVEDERRNPELARERYESRHRVNELIRKYNAAGDEVDPGKSS